MRVLSRARAVALGALTRGLLLAGRLTRDPVAEFLSPGSGHEPYDYYERLRRRGPLVRSRVLRSVWLSTDHATCSLILRDGRFGKIPPGMDMTGVTLSMLVSDPPDHTRLRKLAMLAFTPRAIEKLRGRVEQMAHELLDEVIERGRMDVIADYAAVLPVRVICEILGAPDQDRQQFRRWGHAVASALDGSTNTLQQKELRQAEAEMRVYFERMFEERRVAPKQDLLQALLDAEADGDRLSHDELHEMCQLLLIAGFETTVNLIGNGTRALLQNPQQLELLCADPALLKGAVEEFPRYDSPVQATGRIAQQEVDIGGTRLKRGSQVLAFLGGANHDPTAFADPSRLDIHRENARDHLAFSAGIHFCLGAALARLEGEVAFRALLDRCHGMRAAGPSPRRQTRLLWGLTTLPIEFTPGPRVSAVRGASSN